MTTATAIVLLAVAISFHGVLNWASRETLKSRIEEMNRHYAYVCRISERVEIASLNEEDEKMIVYVIPECDIQEVRRTLKAV